MAVVSLIGIVQGGGPQDTALPTNPRIALRYTHGGSLIVRLVVYENDGILVDLSTASLTLTVKKMLTDYEAAASVFGVVTGDPMSGAAEFTISPATFRYVEPGRYYYDIWLIRGGEDDAVIPTSPFLIEPSVRNVF